MLQEAVQVTPGLLEPRAPHNSPCTSAVCSDDEEEVDGDDEAQPAGIVAGMIHTEYMEPWMWPK